MSQLRLVRFRHAFTKPARARRSVGDRPDGEPSDRARAAALRRRASIRWDTPFGKFVSRLTVLTLVERLKAQCGYEVTKFAIYQWLAGTVSPREHHAIALVQISKGSLTLEDVYGHRAALSSPEPTPPPIARAA